MYRVPILVPLVGAVVLVWALAWVVIQLTRVSPAVTKAVPAETKPSPVGQPKSTVAPIVVKVNGKPVDLRRLSEPDFIKLMNEARNHQVEMSAADWATMVKCHDQWYWIAPGD